MTVDDDGETRNRHTTKRTGIFSDERGIALQTIIVMVVLLAIAGAVATVLLIRAGSETDRLENETVNFADYTTKFGCDTVDGNWAAGSDSNGDGDTDDRGEGTCTASGAPAPNPPYAARTTQAACVMDTPPGSGAGTWDDNGTTGDTTDDFCRA